MENYKKSKYGEEFDDNEDYGKNLEGLLPLTYYEDNLEEIASFLGRLCKYSSQGNIGVDVLGQYSLNSFNKIGIMDDKYLIMRQDDEELTDLILAPKKMIVYLNKDATKNYAMLISGKGKEANNGLDNGSFEHIQHSNPVDISPRLRGKVCWDLINIYKENIPVLIHYPDSVYNMNAEQKDKLLLKYAFPHSNN